MATEPTIEEVAAAKAALSAARGKFGVVSVPEDALRTLLASHASLEEDAAKWRALVGCRMHFMGCSGFDLVEGAFLPRANEPQHFGMEIWSHPRRPDEAGQNSQLRARECLEAVANSALAAFVNEKERT